MPPLAALALGLLAPLTAAAAGPETPHRVKNLRIVLLSTMLAEQGTGEWGFSALVEADGARLLLDTGDRPETVLANARELGLDLNGVKDVVLSHAHRDHAGGLLALRQQAATRDPASLSRAHVATGALWGRPGSLGESNFLIRIRKDYEAAGGVFVEHDKPAQLLPGVWLTGPVPRRQPEQNWTRGSRVMRPSGPTEDDVPEDQSLVFDTERGLVLLSGCCHAGIISTAAYARRFVRSVPLYAAIGGFHLFRASDAQLGWTAGELRGLGLKHFLGAHCTGLEAVYRIRERAGLERRTCVVGAVGASFSLANGIEPLELAH